MLWRMMRRDWRQKEIKLLWLAVLVAAASVTAIALFTQRIEKSMFASASELLAADARVESSLPLPTNLLAAVEQQQLKHAQMLNFQAMAFAGEAMQLTSVKAVTSEYPLRGLLKIADQPDGAPELSAQGPREGEAWINSRLFALLAIKVGDTIELGEARLRVTAALLAEPDAPQSFLNFAPRVLINYADVAATGAIQTGSRIEYALLINAEAPQLHAFHAGLRDTFTAHTRWKDAQNDNSRSKTLFTKMRNYLLLAAGLSLLLAGVAMALASQEYAWRQRKKIALLKTLGQSSRAIGWLYAGQFALLAFTGSLSGLALGWGAHQFLIYSAQGLLPAQLAAATSLPLVMGFSAGVIIFFAFTAPALAQMRKSTPLIILQEFNLNPGAKPAHYGWGFAAVFILIALFTQQGMLSIILLGACLLVLLITAIMGEGAIRLLMPLRRSLPFSWQFGFLAMQRHRAKNRLPLAIFALLFLPLLVIVQTRTRILETWQAQLPEQTPNHFLYNIFAQDRQDIEQRLVANHILYSPFYPMLRGRITQINYQAAKPQKAEDAEAPSYTRELNLTWVERLPADNQIVAGAWWPEASAETAPLGVSLEDNFAEGLGIKVGDQLTLSLAGQSVQAQVQSLRKVHWDAMTPNFFVIFNRPPLDAAVANWIASFYLPSGQKAILNSLVRDYPNISLVELDQTLATLKNIVVQLSRALEAVLALILVAAALVLVTSIQSTLRVRIKESAVMRIAGASRALIHQAIGVEFFLLGWLAAVIGLLASELSLYLIQTQLLELQYEFAWLPWLLAPWLGGSLIAALGWLSTRHITRVSLLSLFKTL